MHSRLTGPTVSAIVVVTVGWISGSGVLAGEQEGPPSAGNAVYKCDFEGYENAPKLKGATTELVTAAAHGGNKALRIQCKSKCIMDLAKVDVDPGCEYVLTLWMKGKGGGMRVKPVTVTGADTSRCADSPHADGADWKEYSFKFKTDETMRAMTLDLRLFGGGDCTFDDIVVAPAGGQGTDRLAADVPPGPDEVFAEAEAGSTEGEVRVVDCGTASGGRCVEWGRGGGSLQVKFKIASAGAYEMWQRVFTSDCWRAEVDGKWTGNPASYPGEWSWVPASQSLKLDAGEHTVRYASASPYGRVDRIWISGLWAKGGAKRRRPQETESKLVEEAMSRLAGSASEGDKARAEAARKSLESSGWKKDGQDYEKANLDAPHLLAFDDGKEMGAPGTALHISPSGSDEDGDGSAGKPWKTFKKAAASAKPGIRVVAAAGTYDERCAVTSGGEPGKYVRFEAEKTGAVSMKGFDLMGPAASFTHIRGFKISGAQSGGISLQGYVHHVTVDDCEITRCHCVIGAPSGSQLVFRRIQGFDNSYGIGLGVKGSSGPQSVLVEDCVLDNNQTGGGERYENNNTDGVGSESYVRGLVLRRVRSSRHGDAGFDIKAPGTIFDSCVAYKNLHYGFKTWEPYRLFNCIAAWNNWAGLDGCFGDYDHCVIYGNNESWKSKPYGDKPGRMANCIVAENKSIDMSVFGAAGGGHNLLLNNGKVVGEEKKLEGDVSADPLFVNPSSAAGDFRLKEGSPAIGAGKKRAEGGPTTDIAGNERTGEKADIGAYASGAKAAVPLISDEAWQARSGGNPAWKLTRIGPK